MSDYSKRSRKIQDIPSVRLYFGTGNAIIDQEFSPGMGWVRRPLRKRVSVSWLRKLRGEGITHVALGSGGKVADFTVEELLRKPRI